jgi:hypothetical protein
MKAKSAILVVYDGAAARDPAMRFCDGLVQRFWPNLTCELNWFDWHELIDEALAREADRKAGEADFLVIAAGSKKLIPSHVQRWIEQAIRHRHEREGVLVGLTGWDSGAGVNYSTATQLYLRKLAHRGGLDYLTAIPQSMPHAEPDSAESYNVRATQMTSLLGSILNRVHSPPQSH